MNDSVLILGEDNIPNNHSKIKIAGFDFDYTLVKTKSKNKFPKNQNDWMIWNPNVIDKIKELIKDNYNFVIISNQNFKGKKLEEMIMRIKNFIKHYKLDCTCFISFKKDKYRKPSPNIWYYLQDKYSIDGEKSFYVGDAAGRKNDFSCSDRKFAFNIGINFYTPEEFFLNQKKDINFKFDGFIPFKYYQISDDIKFKHNTKELIILTGPPCSGKSTFCQENYKNYEYINRDILKTMEKCLELTQKNMELNNSIIVDNTNPSIKSRKPFIELGKKYNYKIKSIKINTDSKLLNHLNWYRCKVSNRDYISQIVFNIYKKEYQDPNLDEGFDDIYNYNTNIKLNNVNKSIFYQLN